MTIRFSFKKSHSFCFKQYCLSELCTFLLMHFKTFITLGWQDIYLWNEFTSSLTFPQNGSRDWKGSTKARYLNIKPSSPLPKRTLVLWWTVTSDKGLQLKNWKKTVPCKSVSVVLMYTPFHFFSLCDQGAKKIIFTACHLGKLKLAFTSPDVISTSPKSFSSSKIDLHFFCYSNSSKNTTCPSGKLKTEFTSPGYRTLLSLHAGDTNILKHCTSLCPCWLQVLL